METFSEPKVTIDLKEYEALKNAPSAESITETAFRGMYTYLMRLLKEQNIKRGIGAYDTKPYIHFEMTYEEFRNHYYNE